jgi:YD repeat-containing protein
VLLAAAVPAIGLAQNGPVTYAYDELGRLVAVIDGSGNAAQYNYDKVGNLLTVTNTTASTVSIFTFTPNNGPTGLTVTIYGDGFSSSPSQDTVTFYNGQNVTPSQASLSTLVVTVPGAATTGPIKVTVGGHSATSSENFTVN